MSKCRKIIYWIMAGVILSLAVSSMILTRNGNIFRFYDDGYVEDLKETWTRNAYYSNKYDEKEKVFSAKAEESACYILWNHKAEEVNYLLIDVAYWNGTEGTWEVHYQNSDGTEVTMDSFAFRDGELEIPLQNIEYERLLLCLRSNGILEYQLEGMRISEFTDLVKVSWVLLGSAVSLLIYIAGSAVFYRALCIRKKKEGQHREGGQFLEQQADLALRYLNAPGAKEPFARWVRIFLIIAIVITWKVIHYGYGYVYAVAVNIPLFLTLVAWIPVEEAGEQQRHPVLKIWLVICALQFVSNILVRKQFDYSEFIEIWMLLCFGLLYRAWGRMRSPQRLVEDFSSGLEILYFLNVLYCIFGDSRKSFTRYLTGVRGNPNPLAIGTGMYLVFFFFRLYQAIRKKKKWYYYLEAVGGIVAGAWILHEANGRTGWIIFLLMVVIFGIFLCGHIFKRLDRRKKIVLGVLALNVTVLVGIFFAWRGEVAYSVDSFSSGRLTIWKCYLEHVGMFGNNNILNFDGTTLAAHNGIIMMMYRYGVFAGIFEIIFLAEIIFTIGRIWRKNPRSEYLLLLAGVFSAYFLASMLDTCDEGIMGWINWFAFYFMIGYLIQEKKLDIRENDG